jgi:enamine deaminase RidA (YjgF/YER057c/UK114 family)
LTEIPMNSITRIETNVRRSRAVIFNSIVFLGGQFADDETQDIRGQTQQTLAKIDQLLDEAGTCKSRLLTAQIWIKDIQRDFATMNEVWDAWTTPGASPTRATAQCEMATPGMLIEIVVTAAAKPRVG